MRYGLSSRFVGAGLVIVRLLEHVSIRPETTETEGPAPQQLSVFGTPCSAGLQACERTEPAKPLGAPASVTRVSPPLSQSKNPYIFLNPELYGFQFRWKRERDVWPSIRATAPAFEIIFVRFQPPEPKASGPFLLLRHAPNGNEPRA